MTLAQATADSLAIAAQGLTYRVAMPNPCNHLFEVTLQISDWQADRVTVQLPAWTPGSYLLREYVRHLQGFQAQTTTGQPLPWRKLRKNAWQIETQGHRDLQVSYQVLATELTVRTNHLDRSHGFFTPAALCLYIEDWRDRPCQVEIIAPEDWTIATALPAIASNRFQAADYDTLVDSPFELGPEQTQAFTVLGKKHYWRIWGGSLNSDRLVADTTRLIETEAQIFGGLPYDHYWFILHLSSGGYGGLEHRDSTVLAFDRHTITEPEGYRRFLQLVAHEFFHLWNVKRIRPKALEQFDYEAENYTPSLWFSEGATSYYDLLLPLRAGLYGVNTFLEALSKDLSRYLTTPGRTVQPLSESSFDAWVKLYRRDAYSDNQQMSYYLKGQLVCWLLDLEIRHHQPDRSFDDVLRLLWQRYGQPQEVGFEEAELRQIFSEVAGVDLTNFFDRYVDGLEELPIAEAIESVGLKLQPQGSDHPSHGLRLADEQGRCQVKFVASNSPGEQAGLMIGDELVALNGLRVTAESFTRRLGSCQAGQTLELTIFHDDQLQSRWLTLAEPQPQSYTLRLSSEATPEQRDRFQRWLGLESQS
ncbi:M61 family metallopeptidase [Synechococcus elongatus]|uniref:M61 family metallopeptidase n=1 Tax=Synechococcus elongatus TaxID=32046 RepID=UPI0030CD9FFE